MKINSVLTILFLFCFFLSCENASSPSTPTDEPPTTTEDKPISNSTPEVPKTENPSEIIPPTSQAIIPISSETRSTLTVVVKEILELLKKKDLAAVNQKYIHPTIGLYDVFRPGAIDDFNNFKAIEKGRDEEIFGLYPALFNVNKNFTIREIEFQPIEFDCDNMVWKNEGLFVFNDFKYPKLSDLIKFKLEFEMGDFSQEDIKRVETIEKDQYKVVLTKNDVIFHLSKIDGSWFITLVDRVTTDCSA